MARVLFLVLLLAAALTACGGKKAQPQPAPTASPAPAPPTDEERIDRALDRRADRIASARRPRRLGLRGAQYIVDNVKVDGRSARVKARLAYGVRGITGDFGSQRVLKATKSRGRWRITGLAGHRSQDPWEIDDYRREQTPHFVVWTPDDIAAPIDALEAGYARLQEVLSDAKLRRRYLVVVARDGSHARQLTDHIEGLESLTAITDTQVRMTGAAERVAKIASQRLIIVNSQFGATAPSTQQTVVTHELTHAALAPVTSGRVPAWLVEGVALYVSGDDRRLEYLSLPSVPTLAALSAPDAISRTIGHEQAAAYATASAAAYTIAERYGRDKLLRLFEIFQRDDLKGKRGNHKLSDRATERVLGVNLHNLQQEME